MDLNSRMQWTKGAAVKRAYKINESIPSLHYIYKHLQFLAA